MDVKFGKQKLPKGGTVVFLVGEDLKLSPTAKALDKSTKGAITKAIKTSDFKGKKGKSLSILGNLGEVDRVVLTGVGTSKEGVVSEYDVTALGGTIASFLNHANVKKATVVVEQKLAKLAEEEAAAHIANGTRLRSYRFDKYFTKKKAEDKPSLAVLTFALNGFTKAKSAYNSLEKITDGVFLTRDVVSEPPNVLYPESYAKICKELSKIGVKVEVLNEKQMEKLGMGALLGVGQGSTRESRMVVMQWNGGKKNAKPVAFVGKGVTFDTGGISIKPSDGMDEMKYDMGGSGTVVGLMKALAGRKAQVNAIGVIGLVENMPDGNAQRPGDVVTSMSGQTIEVLNTDAEGRLVLVDALWYTQDRFKPQFMVNLATLTGAIVVALGVHRAGLFSNNDQLSERLSDAGEVVGEKLWRLPMGKEYDKQIDSKVADVQNISNTRGGGSITAGQFLERFVNEVPWAHLDIAGVAWTKKNLDVVPEGASGFGVRLLDRLVAEHYEH